MAVETQVLTKLYRNGGGCREVTLSLEAGRIFGLLGPNGAGKSTLVKTLVGLVRPTSGAGRLFGHPLRSPEAQRSFGFLPELFRYQDWMTGRELLDFHGHLRRVPPRDLRRRREEVLALVGLIGRENQRLGSYSKGMQQRLGLAVALIGDPPLLFLDEPTSALDPVGRREVREVIRNLRAAGKTVFLNSHLLSEVELVCDRVAVIHQGRMLAEGPPQALRKREVEVELVADQYPEALLSGLRRLARQVERTDQGLRLVLSERADIPEVARLAVGEGVSVYALTPRPPALEDVFLELVKGGGADNGGDLSD
ncbi:MAG: ABC transporter ATP-binding protein [Bacillota bacterium]|nr:ABC transporter ATP-binding protein [Bacillota bacterium]